MSETMSDADTGITLSGNILAFDRDWQYPAITEQHAFHRLRALGGVPDGVTYLAYPWATLFDKIQKGALDTDHYRAQFETFCRHIPQDTIKVTVCQHVKLKEYLSFFETSGVSHVFWSHATVFDVTNSAATPRLHPFPLFPVQNTTPPPPVNNAPRPHLFSFIGARSDQYYLSPVRNWILDTLKDHPAGLIVGRKTWHYDKVVYDHQILGKALEDQQDLVEVKASSQFRAGLERSTFSLCPSGTGPNSIRLWESLAAGAIPVILSDAYIPPGPREIWENAAVICAESETAVISLPDRLAKIAATPGKLRDMRRLGHLLWERYGPENFVPDILELTEVFTAHTAYAAALAMQPARSSIVLAQMLANRPVLSEPSAVLFLRMLSADLLLYGPETWDSLDARELLERAINALEPDHPVLAHYEAVRSHIPGSVRGVGTNPPSRSTTNIGTNAFPT